MIYQHTIRGFVVALLIFSAGLLSAQTDEEEFQQLYQEYMQINQRLQQVQQQAFQDAVVAEHAEEYSSLVDAKLREIDTRAEELIDRRENTIDEIEAAQEEGDFEVIQELQQVYEQVTQELQPFMQQAMEDPAVQEMRTEFEEVLIAKMQEIDPEAGPLFDRMAELEEKLNRMMQQQ